MSGDLFIYYPLNHNPLFCCQVFVIVIVFVQTLSVFVILREKTFAFRSV